MKRIIKSLLTALITVAALLPFHVSSGQEKGNRTPMNSGKEGRTSYRNYIWIEGEDAAGTNFSKEKTFNFFCSNRYALQLSRDAAPASERGYYASYTFHVPRSKRYDFWMASTPPGSTRAEKPGYASPIQWKIDTGEFQTASSENTFAKEYYAPGGFYWVKISTGRLSAGKHTLTLRVNQKRTSGWDYYFYIDAILFIPTYSGDLVSLMKFPDIAPDNFKTGGRGITFNKADHYKLLMNRDINYRENLFNLLQVYGWLYENNKAADECREYLKTNPKDIEIRILLASNLAWGGRVDEAIREYKNIVSIDKNNITARKLMAVLAGWNNRYDEAIRIYEEIIKIDPRNVDAYISLATQLSWKGEMERAISIFQKAESIAPRNIEVLYALGDNYNWTGKSYDAIRQYRKIISLDEKEINAYKKLAAIYLDAGQAGKASELMEEAERIRRIYPELSSFSLDIKGEQEKQQLATVKEYLNALKKDPEDLEARKNLIDNYRWNREYEKAEKEYTNLLSIKTLKQLDTSGEKIERLETELVKLALIGSLLKSLHKELETLESRYTGLSEKVRKGSPLPEDLNEAVIHSDYAKINGVAGKADIIEKALSELSQVLSFYNRDIRGFLSQKNTLNWEIDSDRLVSQGKKAYDAMKGNFRFKKVLGIMELLYGSPSQASSTLSGVYKNDPSRIFPEYPLALVLAGRFQEAEKIVAEAGKGKVLKKGKLQNLRNLIKLLQKLRGGDTGSSRPPSGKRGQKIEETAKLATDTAKRIRELEDEQKRKLIDGKRSIRRLYEKGILEQENRNVPLYREIGQFFLNRNSLREALEFYHNILQVQPLNVDINFKLGNLNAAAGYWHTAMKNFEICINNQVDNGIPRKKHYELQKEHSPSLESKTFYYSESAVTRITENLEAVYPLNDWFTLKGGYGFINLDEKGGESQAGQTYPGIDKGKVMRHTGTVETRLGILPISTEIYLEGSGNIYSGEVDFEYYDTYDSTIHYSTFNYGGGIRISPLFTIMSLRLGYRYEDISDLTQSLRLSRRDEITSKTIDAALDISTGALEFPLSDRIFLYDSIKYRMLSDTNKRTSSYNELTFRLFRFSENEMSLDLAGVYSYESSSFREYQVTGASDLPFLPYWAPENLGTYGGGVRWNHTINNFLKGSFQYNLAFQYTLDTEGNRNMNPGLTLKYEGDHISAGLSYLYSYSKIEPTSANPDPDPFISHDVRFSVKGRFFTIYTPKGSGKEPINLISISPKFITADNDGKNDFTVITMTAFDETGISSWRLDFTNTKGTVVNTIARKGAPPATLKWDGTDNAGNLLPTGDYYSVLTIVNSGGKKSTSRRERIFLSRKKRAVTLEKSYTGFSPNGDGVRDRVSFEINASDKEGVENWKVSIRGKRGRKELREISGFEFLPYDVQWDGKDSRGEPLKDGEYLASLRIKYRDGKFIQSPPVEVIITRSITIGITTDKKSFIPGKSSVKIIPRSSKPEVESWKVMFTAPDKSLIRIITGSGRISSGIVWDGRDRQGNVVGYNIPVNIVMEVTDKAGNSGKSERSEVWLDFLIREEGGKKTVYLFDQGILHLFKKAGFKPESDRIISRLITVIGRMGHINEMRISSYTSSDGSEKNNISLSKNRAVALSNRLRESFGGARFITEGRGESAPFDKDKTGKWDTRYEIEISNR